MEMERKISIGEILQNSGLSSNAGSYSGRSIDFGDITAKKLSIISKKILENLGEQKQSVFNQMVLDLPTLKPSFFIEFACRLSEDKNGEWWWEKEIMLNHYSGYYSQDLLNMPICITTEQIKKEFKQLI